MERAWVLAEAACLRSESTNVEQTVAFPDLW